MALWSPDAGLPIEIRQGLRLVLADSALAQPYFELVSRNLERLALWEPWAQVPQSLSGTRVYLAWQAQGFGVGTIVPALIELDGELVGNCSARIDKADGVAEIGYWLDEAQEGAGIAALSVGALVDHVFERTGVGRVQARTATHNDRSRRLLERLGFEFEGVLRSSQRLGDRRVDMAMYARVAAAG